MCTKMQIYLKYSGQFTNIVYHFGLVNDWFWAALTISSGDEESNKNGLILSLANFVSNFLSNTFVFHWRQTTFPRLDAFWIPLFRGKFSLFQWSVLIKISLSYDTLLEIPFSSNVWGAGESSFLVYLIFFVAAKNRVLKLDYFSDIKVEPCKVFNLVKWEADAFSRKCNMYCD